MELEINEEKFTGTQKRYKLDIHNCKVTFNMMRSNKDQPHTTNLERKLNPDYKVKEPHQQIRNKYKHFRSPSIRSRYSSKIYTQGIRSVTMQNRYMYQFEDNLSILFISTCQGGDHDDKLNKHLGKLSTQKKTTITKTNDYYTKLSTIKKFKDKKKVITKIHKYVDDSLDLIDDDDNSDTDDNDNLTKTPQFTMLKWDLPLNDIKDNIQNILQCHINSMKEKQTARLKLTAKSEKHKISEYKLYEDVDLICFNEVNNNMLHVLCNNEFDITIDDHTYKYKVDEIMTMITNADLANVHKKVILSRIDKHKTWVISSNGLINIEVLQDGEIYTMTIKTVTMTNVFEKNIQRTIGFVHINYSWVNDIKYALTDSILFEIFKLNLLDEIYGDFNMSQLFKTKNTTKCKNHYDTINEDASIQGIYEEKGDYYYNINPAKRIGSNSNLKEYFVGKVVRSHEDSHIKNHRTLGFLPIINDNKIYSDHGAIFGCTSFYTNK